MIIQCESCSRKFIVKDSDITSKGRMVQCGYCSVTWHQMPISAPIKTAEQEGINEPDSKTNEDLSVDAIKASDGKTYKFLGSQWAQLFPSGKTGLFAKRKIGKELDKLTGRERKSATKRGKKIKKAVLEAHKHGEIGGYGGKMSHYISVEDADYNVLRKVVALLKSKK